MTWYLESIVGLCAASGSIQQVCDSRRRILDLFSEEDLAHSFSCSCPPPHCYIHVDPTIEHRHSTMPQLDHFYDEFHGHRVQDLEVLLPVLRLESSRLVWTAGDSSLDNKYWFPTRVPAQGVYAQFMETSKPDVTYWLNQQLNVTAINAAVEATTLHERTRRFRSQDDFVRDNLQSQDILIVSIGGNDVALRPLLCTACSLAGIVLCMPGACIDNGRTCGTVPCDDYCGGCGPSLASCLCAMPPCLGYLRHLFGTRVQKYVERLTATTKPAKVLVCMIYYLDEVNHPCWASSALGLLGYNRDPRRVQALIRRMFIEATSRIHIEGTTVIPVPLYRVLDGSDTTDYIQRVEPSVTGGRKMAEYLAVSV